MELWNEQLASQTPRLGETQNIDFRNKVVRTKFIGLGSSYSWYVVEAEQTGNGDVLFYGYIDSGNDSTSEWGYFPLSHLQNITWQGVPVVERDLEFVPCVLRELMSSHRSQNERKDLSAIR